MKNNTHLSNLKTKEHVKYAYIIIIIIKPSSVRSVYVQWRYIQLNFSCLFRLFPAEQQFVKIAVILERLSTSFFVIFRRVCLVAEASINFISLHPFIYIYIYIYTHTHTHIYIYIYNRLFCGGSL